MKMKIWISLAVVLASTAANAQQAPSREEQAACRGDATRYCASSAGKPTEMNACLRANKAKLSSACKAVVEARGG
jgi:hypothetical protein